MPTRKQVDQMIIEEALSTWEALNNIIRNATEDMCQTLMRHELDYGKRRPQFVMRIYSRLNRVRAVRERRELKVKLIK